MSLQDQVLDSMRGIIDPDLGKDIVSLGFIKKLEISKVGEVSFVVELTTPACPVKEHFRTSCEAAVQALPWVKSVSVEMSAQKRANSALQGQSAGLANVRNIIAVASCKGGVGKSTVATNLACALGGTGASVGIFDADIYGPSLSVMIDTPFQGLVQRADRMIEPVEHHGLKLMSFAYANPGNEKAAILRGPMVTQIINQLLTGTDWGELDYLVLDLPPGTGDIQLTLCQLVPLTAAVIVTTPQNISFIDVAKGIRMFDTLKVPTVAVVENMSYYICDECDKKHYIFGRGAMRKLVEQFGFTNTVSLPMHPAVAACGDHGLPLVWAEPDTETAQSFRDLAGTVAREISRRTYGGISAPAVTFEDGVIVIQREDAERVELAPRKVRLACACAVCINEMTGEKVLRDEDVPEDVQPQSIEPMGNYAVAVQWSDEHSSIYPYDRLDESK